MQMGIGGIPDAVFEVMDGLHDLGIHTEMLSDGAMRAMRAIEVDLTGQICPDSIGTRIYPGFGGQVDFIRGAARSRGGKPIIALPSTARGPGAEAPCVTKRGSSLRNEAREGLQ